MATASPQMYPAHLKKVLKSYQTAAMTSLSGPSRYECNGQDVSPKKAIETTNPYEKERIPPVSRVLTVKKEPDASVQTVQLPILFPPDQSLSKLEETFLEGESIACFNVGGEKRLCFPQVMNRVLRNFDHVQISSMAGELNIDMAHCNQKQLLELKDRQILQASAPSCGLITKSNAERLCSALLSRFYRHSSKLLQNRSDLRQFSFQVEHECFGEGKGLCVPELYFTPTSPCIECLYCSGIFSPDKFVCHVHQALENRICHWGFDSANWRHYLRVCKDERDTEKYDKELDAFKAKFKIKRREQVSNQKGLFTKRLKVEPTEVDSFHKEQSIYTNGLQPPQLYGPFVKASYSIESSPVARHPRCQPLLHVPRELKQAQSHPYPVEANVTLIPRCSTKQVDDFAEDCSRGEQYLSTDSDESASDLTQICEKGLKCDWVELENVQTMLRASSVGSDLVGQIRHLLRRANHRVHKHVMYLNEEYSLVKQENEKLRACLSSSERHLKGSPIETEILRQEPAPKRESQVDGNDMMEAKLLRMQRELTDLRQEIASFRGSSDGNQRGSVITSGAPEIKSENK